MEGKRRRYDKANHRKKTPADRKRGGGGRDEDRRLKKTAGAMTRETNVETLPRIAIMAGGRDEKGKTYTKWKGGTTSSLARGEVPS